MKLFTGSTTDTWVGFTDYSKDNSYVNNYNLYATVCYSIPMSPLIVSVFLYFDIILFIRKEKKRPYLRYSLILTYPLCLSNRKKEFQLYVNNKCARIISRKCMCSICIY